MTVPSATPPGAAPVVVGIDGSDHSERALDWAARYAALTRSPLEVIAVWHLPTSYGWTLPIPSDWDPVADTKSLLEREVKEVLGAEPSATLRLAVLQGPPGKVLVDASERASLIVVGTRGRGELAGVLLGSVSAFVTVNAHCPVVVVPDRTDG